MEKRWKLIKQYRNSVLAEWIFTGVLILLIPIAYVILTAFYSRQLLQDKLEEMSGITLNNVQYSIDGYLNDLRENSYYILMGKQYQNLEKMVSNDEMFLNAVEVSFADLANKGKYNNEIDTLIYLPEKDFIVTNSVADYSEFIYNSIKYKIIETEDSSMISREQWLKTLNEMHKNQFIISTAISYQHFGKPALVYAFTNPYSAHEDWEKRMRVYSSVSCDFINALLKETDSSILFIVDGEGSQLSQFGGLNAMHPEGWKEKIYGDKKSQSFTYDKERYVYSYKKSDLTDWYYILAVPESNYFDSTRSLTNITVIGIILVACFGLTVTFLLNTKNYRKITTIMDLLPSGKNREEGKNELDVLYSSYQSMNKENMTLKQFFESRVDSIRKLFWMDKLKGRTPYLSDDDMINSLNIPMQRWWAVVSVDTEGWSDGQDIYSNENYDLISFSIKNVIDEVMSDRFSYEILEDGDNIVLLFSLSEKELEDWKVKSAGIFQEIYIFFQNTFKLQLSIIVSGICEKIESLSACYSAVQEAVQYQAVLQNSGVIWVEDMLGSKLESLELWEEYRHRCILLMTEGSETGIRKLMDELFSNKDIQEEELYVVRCQIYALAGALLLRHKSAISGIREMELKAKLLELTGCDTWINMKLVCLELFPLFIETEDEKDKEQSRLVLDIKRYVEKEYSNQDLNITMISEVFNLSPSHLSKLFKNETGIGLLSYINDYRIRKAQELLNTTKKTVYEIADMVGYANVRSFQRNFMAIVGVSPNDYRREKSV